MFKGTPVRRDAAASKLNPEILRRYVYKIKLQQRTLALALYPGIFWKSQLVINGKRSLCKLLKVKYYGA